MRFKISKLFFVILSILSLNIITACNNKVNTEDTNTPLTQNLFDYEVDYDKTKPIYVIGHLNPDLDTIGSSIAYANLLNQIGYNALPVRSGEINAEAEYALKKFNVDIPELLTDASDKQFVIIDHSSFAQSIANMDKAKILAIIDHHAVGDMVTSYPIMYVGMPVGCTSTIVYDLYQDYNQSIPKDMAGMMISAILSDTLGLKSSTTTDHDSNAVNKLSKIAEINDYYQYTIDLLNAGNILDTLTTEQILKYDYKKFTANKIIFSIGVVQSSDDNQLKRIENDLNSYLKDNFDSLEVYNCYVMMTNIMKLETKLLCYGPDSLKHAQEAFNVSSDEIILSNTNSRKKQIAPPLIEVLSKIEN